MQILEILKSLNWVDFLIIFLFLKLIYTGAKVGLTAELFKLIGTIISIAVGFHYYEEIAKSLVSYIDLPVWFAQFIVLLVVVITVSVIFKYGVALVFKILNIQFVSQLERIGGILVGLARGILIGGLFLIALSLFPIEYFYTSVNTKSLLAPYLIKSTTKTYTFIISIIPSQEPKKIDISPPAKQTKEKSA